MEDFDIKKELQKLPHKPGVYLMHKKDGEIIYVGKAKNLYNRVRQYFSDSYKKTNKILQMVSYIDYFEYIVVDNELESLILESNLIKEYKPRYNTLLKDDKNYPYIKITVNENYPRVFFVHKKSKDKALYFGPYKSSNTVNMVLEFIKDNFKIRSCNININKDEIIDFKNIDVEKVDNKIRKECLYYHIGMCLAPCINKNIKDEYDKNIKNIISFLSGNAKNIISELETKMKNYSDSEQYEKAAVIRDKIISINEILEKQKIDQKNETDKDIIGIFKGNDIAVIQIFEIRDGKIIDRNINFLNIDKNDDKKEILESFIKQYYNEPYFMPNEIWLPYDIDDKELLEEFLSKDLKRKVKLIIPKIGLNDKLIKLANTNAKIQWEQRAKKYEKDTKYIDIAYDVLKKITGESQIKRLESYDISNTAGSINVASMVCFEGYNFKKNDYRKFKIKTVIGADDYESMREVIDRRLNRYKNNDKSFINLPDIFLIDGGKGQVNAVVEVLKKYDLDIPVIGMVKDDNHRTRGIIYLDNEIDLSDYKELFKFITKIQDETHRFAIEYHRSLRSKEQVHSLLNDIKGIGDKKRMDLIEHFENIENIKKATIDDLLKVKQFTKKDAQNVYDFFNKE